MRLASDVDRDRGSTLVELLLVVVILGLVGTVISLAFVAIVRTSPSTEARVDDSRTVLGLNVYLPEDVNSTPPGGYDLAKSSTTGCTGASPGVNLAKLTWSELSNTYTSSYRYVGTSEGYRVVRHACANGGAPTVTNLTSDLPAIDETAWMAGDEPIVVTPFVVDAEIQGLTFRVTTTAGEVFQIEARTNNPAVTLPPEPPVVYPPPPAGNQPPAATPVTGSVVAGSSTVISLEGTDPDGDSLSATVSNVAAGWTVTVISGLEVTVTPPPAATSADVAGTFDYTVTDSFGQTASSDATIQIIDAPANNAPTADDVTQTVAERTPTPIALPVTDVDGDPLSVTLTGIPASLSVTVSGTQIVVESDGTTSSPGPFTYLVDDGEATASGTITITVNVCQVTSLTPSSPSVSKFTNGTNKDQLKSDVTLTIAAVGNCSGIVTLSYDNDNNGTLEFLTFPSPANQVTFRRQELTWTGGSTFVFDVYVRGVVSSLSSSMTVTS